MFDNLTITKLGFYVYALLNPLTNKVFYIGKGLENRVFAHKNEVLENRSNLTSLKSIEIREILDKKLDIKHLIIRHGLTEKEAFLVEATLIDYHNFSSEKLTNEVAGHQSRFYGIKTTDELIRQYNTPKLDSLFHKVIIININKKYAIAKSSNLSIYEATKESWVMSKDRFEELEYALAEFEGIIIGVYKINNWYPSKTNNNKRNYRWGFNGDEASIEIKEIYFNKSIQHIKKKGAANPIRYNL